MAHLRCPSCGQSGRVTTGAGRARCEACGAALRYAIHWPTLVAGSAAIGLALGLANHLLLVTVLDLGFSLPQRVVVTSITFAFVAACVTPRFRRLRPA